VRYPPLVVSGYAETTKWFFTLLIESSCHWIYQSRVFLIKYTIYSIGLKYLQRNKVAYFGFSVCTAFLYNNCHFRNEAIYNLLSVGFDFY